jgi:carbonic anhydrase
MIFLLAKLMPLNIITGSDRFAMFNKERDISLVPPYGPDDQPHGVSSAIEFAVRALRVPDIIVMGHAMCGGIAALLDGAPPEVSDFVGQWVRIAESARQRALATATHERQRACEHEAVRLSLANLMTFPWIKSAVEGGSLTLHGCYFGIHSGVLERLGGDGTFRAIDDTEKDE